LTTEGVLRFADAIVVAAGSSSRMGGVDKLDHRVGNRWLLAYAIEAIAATPEVRAIIVVTVADRIEQIRSATWLPDSVRAVVAGGEQRHESVAAGLAALDRLDDDRGTAADRAIDPIVLVHDGARPFVHPELASRIARAAAEHGAAIPVLPLAETLKRVDGDRIAGTIERAGLATAQTPQGVRRSLLREAFRQYPPDGPESWTDEAALLEACNIAVHAIPGDPSNFKVTLPGDLARFDAAVAARQGGDAHAVGAGRVGLGHDRHPFGPGSPLMLGGLAIEGAPRLHGHSDGDVVLHAIADAILGAAGLGDLGRLFPAVPETPPGVASSELLGDVARRMASAGFAIANIDVTIVAARPTLGASLPAMGRRVAELLDLEPGLVNVKASTGNLAGSEGAGRGIAAEAIVSLMGAR
jgi:2-C-methyl-D-erythritol 4-phosphate cytidylyltransferase/2-C-methyl-D-erythritol 2,4-cyclodiphosphate synthase